MTNMLSVGRSALLAYSGALSTVGENVANANSAGYVRRTADLKEAPPPQGGVNVNGNGVRAAGVERQWNQFLADTARGDAASAAREGLRYAGAQQIERALDDGTAGVGQSMTGFFNAARTLAVDPASVANQAQLRNSLESVTAAFRRSASALDNVVAQSDAQIDARLAITNQQLADLATINQRITSALPNSSEFAALADSRDRSLAALAQTVGAVGAIDGRGRATVMLDGADEPLVSGNSAATLVRGERGAIIASSDRGTHAIAATGGEVGGLQSSIIKAQDRRTDIDTLAAEFTATINSWAQQGRTTGGTSGQSLLTSSSAADVSTTAALADALPMADSFGVPNGNLVALAAVRRSSGLEDRWDMIVASHGQFTASAKIVSDASQLLADGSASRLDASTAVDLDTEAADLIRYQQAYQAAARVIRAADEALSAILQIV